MNIKNEKGVTLLILVITIVLMLIIAGSSLAMIFDANGLLKSSQNAQDAQKNHANLEEQKTDELINELDSQMQEDYKDESGANQPKLKSGMIPVKWNGTNWLVTDTKDSQWYNYTDKKWANIMLTDGLTIEGITDVNTATISQMKGKKVTILGSMYVWIPRYAYQITSNYHNGGEGINGNINIKFLKGTTNESTDGKTIWDNVSGQGNWNIHPAFKYGESVSGIWVAKFEASHTGCTTTETTGRYDGTAKTLQVKPGVTSWREITVNNIYTVCLNYNTALNSHLMKNSEWGACAYLAQSSYGKNSEIWINSNSNYITGQAGTGVSVGGTTSTYAYDNTTYGVQASTTGNVYGIYDMSGGNWEYTASYVNNGNASLTNYGTSLVNGASKTKDVYNVGSSDDRANNYTANGGRYGDAVYETSGTYNSGNGSWYGDYSFFPYSDSPFFLRGGHCSDSTSAGGFCFTYHSGSTAYHCGFRPVLVIL